MLTPRRVFTLCLVLAALVPAALHADVKTRQRTQLKLEGMMGRLMNMASGGAADGLTSTVVVKGARKSEINDRTGRIVDLTEQKVYELDVRRKEYRVVTFAELRAQWEKAKADAEKSAKDLPAEDRDQLANTGAEVEILVDVQESGQTRTIAGHTAKQVVVTMTAKEKSKALEESGGLVITTDAWVTPRIATLDEIAQFDVKFVTAVYGDQMFGAAQQLAGLVAMYPSLTRMLADMDAKLRALDGTILSSTMKIETVRSAAALAQTPTAPAGGGLGGALARRLGAGRKPEPRSLISTSISETQSIESSATDADVAIPAGFKNAGGGR